MEKHSTGGRVRLIKRTVSVGLKVAAVVAIAAVVIYRLRFAPVPVLSHMAGSGPIVAEVMGTGTLEARVQATISAKFAGRIADVLVDQGDRVAKGQLVATLDVGDLRQQVEMAKAELSAIRAGVDRAAADIASAEANAVQLRAAYEREAQLAKKKYASQESLDKATQQRDVAEAQLKRARMSKLEVERQVVTAEETLRYHQERLADSQITSPFDGLVTRRAREAGDIVVPGSEILQIISNEQMWVSAWVDETAMSSVKAGQPARVVFRSEPEKSYCGSVSRISPMVDGETREFLVDVTVEELPATWAVGQRAEVYLQISKKDEALLVPQRAIAWEKGRPGLFVNHAGHAQWHSLALGIRGAESCEVLEGVAAGEQVIWPRDAKGKPLTEGRAVAPASAP